MVKYGVVTIENPCQAFSLEIMPVEEMKEICSFAKSQNISTHLDGTRLFSMSCATNVPVSVYTEIFDTVVISLQKHFSCHFGAILAGPEHFIRDMFHERRMLGGSLPRASLPGIIAVHQFPTFMDKMTKAVKKVNDLYLLLAKFPEISVDFDLVKKTYGLVGKITFSDDVDGAQLSKFLESQKIRVMNLKPQTFFLRANSTANNLTNDYIIKIFSEAISKCRKQL